MPTLTPNLWFDDNAHEAAAFYVSIFPNSRITSSMPVVVNFELDGQPFSAINGGPVFELDPAFSIAVDCADQAEVDHWWETLLADGGEESECGWLKDRFGVSWQIVPSKALGETLGHPDPAAAERARQAMFTMRKLDIAALYAAVESEPEA